MARPGRALLVPGALRAALRTTLATLLAVLVLTTGALLAPAQAAPGDPTPGVSTGSTTDSGTTTGDGATTGAPRSSGTTDPAGPRGPQGPKGTTGSGDGSVTIDVGSLTDKPSQSIVLLIVLTLLSLAPAILLTCTSFTKILVVLGLTRNALGLQQTPPNQVLAGLALFLSLFIMAPVLSQMNSDGVQPYLDGTKTSSQAWDDGLAPLRAFMLDNTDDDELTMLTDVARRDQPKTREDVPMTTLVPAFILSELKDAFIIGFIIFIPFLVIDIVVSGALMALGMMMMPPVMVSLPFKLLLFVLVNGWGLIITALVQSYQT
ncbi:flagellar type III secretion system pore protein FliP [Nocardioides sp. TRM66260-LWL]|uniref:flagellar type III secretion system pore protein FliP n=1 Tax=Nocardioides sp. TRM66260-LWL TaxID=2874478 RepID=UPI001CC6EC0F|nr:flagellar type III secretion system pore protein FliP [Nocardioides sp. TRM66260-LWL]MBZ5735195.1 flagellar type III secretion system pore protein FliP [Nocardioides sp. TRM66260-LWL]